MYLFGSSLIRKQYPNFREPADIDYVTNSAAEYIELALNGPKLDPETGKKIEYHFLPFLPDRELTLDELLTIKQAHAIYDVNWDKTMGDIKFLTKVYLRGRVHARDDKFTNVAEKFFAGTHTVKRTDFNRPLETFFDDNVDREIPHDELHLMLHDFPAYKAIVKPGSAKPLPENFHDLPWYRQCDVLFEEAFVIAIERYRKLKLPYSAYYAAQRDLITRLHPEWLAKIAVDRWAYTLSCPRDHRSFNRYMELYSREKLR